MYYGVIWGSTWDECSDVGDFVGEEVLEFLTGV